MPKAVALELLPHPKAPLFEDPAKAQLLFQQIISEIKSDNFQLPRELWELVRQASLVNLWFFLKYVAGYAQQFDRLTDHLHVEMCNFRQKLNLPGVRGFMIIPRGFCKCLHEDELLWVENKGLLRAGDLRIGDRLLGYDRERTDPEIVRVEANLPGRTFGVEVQLRSGRRIKVAAAHQFATLEGWTEAQELQTGDRIAILSDIPGRHFENDEEYFIGLIYGDGSTRTGMLTLTNVEPEVNTFAHRFWPRCRVIESPDRTPTLSFYGGIAWWKERKLSLERSIEKDYPASMQGSTSFLQGLFDTDGTVSKNGWVSYSSSSRKLALGVLHELGRFGIFSSLYYIPKTHSWRVQVIGRENNARFGGLIGFRVQRKQQRIKWTQSRSNTYDTLPFKWEDVLHHGDAFQLRRAGLRVDNHYWPTRAKVLRAAQLLEREDLEWLVYEPLVWDYVKTITPLGQIPVARIQVSGPANYACAQGILHHNTKICTEGGGAWDLLRNPDEAIRISNAIVDTARDFMLTARSIYDTNEFMEWAFPEYYIKHPNSQDRWNANEFVLPNRTRHRREASVEFGGVTASAEGHHHTKHIIDDPIGLAALDASRGANAVMQQAKNWFWTSDPTLLDSARTAGVIGIGTRYAVDDLYGDVLKETCEVHGCEMMDFEPNPEGRWIVYYRKAIEHGKAIYPEEWPLEAFEELQAKEQGWWTYITQYQNEPQSSGMSELYEHSFKTFTMEWEQERNLWFINVPSYRKEIYLGDCDVIIVGDPAATEGYRNARTSRTAVGVLATHCSGMRFLIWLRAGYVEPTKMMDWLFDANDTFASYRRGTFLEVNGPFKILVDPKTGRGVLREEERKRGKSLTLRGFNVSGDKDARIRSYLQPALESGNLFVLESSLSLIDEERKAFPMSSKKDILDMLASAVMLSTRPMSESELVKRKEEDDEFENRIHGAAGY